MGELLKQLLEGAFKDCRCTTLGWDDGPTTCFMHHDCYRGECSHQDVDQYGNDIDEVMGNDYY